MLNEASRPVAIVGEGAFSNIAAAVESLDEPTLSKLDCIAIMGGETQRVMSDWYENTLAVEKEPTDSADHTDFLLIQV